MSRPETLPDLEDLAAYIDGRLDDARRLEVEARLADDEDYYELFLETTRLQEDLAEEVPATNGGAKIVSIRRRRGLLAGLAAAAALALVVGWSLWESDPLARLDANAVVAHPALDAHGVKVFRGSRARSEETVAYVLGVWAVDLEVAQASGTGEAVARMKDFTKAIEWYLQELAPIRVRVHPIRREVGDFSGCLEEERVDEAQGLIPPLLEQLEEAIQRFDLQDSYERGRWVEMGRLAALVDDRELLATSIREIRARFTGAELGSHQGRIRSLERELETGLRSTPEAREARLEVFRELHYDFS